MFQAGERGQEKAGRPSGGASPGIFLGPKPDRYRALEAPAPPPRRTPACPAPGRAAEGRPRRCAGPAGESDRARSSAVEREAALSGAAAGSSGPEVHSRRHDAGPRLSQRCALHAGRPADRGAAPAGAPSTLSGEPPWIAPRPCPRTQACPWALRRPGPWALCSALGFLSIIPERNARQRGPAPSI